MTASSSRRILALALPAMLALAADPLLSLVDTAIVGALGTVQLAALGIDAAVFTAVFWLFNFLTYGTTAEVARLRGAGRPDEAAAYAVQALWLAAGLGLTVGAVLLLAGGPIVDAMGAEGDVAGQALAYLRVRALAAVPVLVVAVGNGVFRGLHDTRTPLGVAVVANLGNAVVSWVLVHPAGLGIAGAAWGTVLAQTAAAAAFLVLGRRALPSPALGVDAGAMRRIATISRDLFLRTASLLAALTLSTAVAARMGTATVAAQQVARELWTLLTLVLDGFAVAAQALIAGALGAGATRQATADARRLLGWGVATGALVGACYLALGGMLPRLFTDDPRVLAEVAAVWPIIALLQPIGGAVFVLDGVLMGSQDFGFLLRSTALAALGGLLPVALFALVTGAGLTGIWVGMAVMMVTRLVATVARLRGGRWARSASGARATTL